MEKYLLYWFYFMLLPNEVSHRLNEIHNALLASDAYTPGDFKLYEFSKLCASMPTVMWLYFFRKINQINDLFTENYINNNYSNIVTNLRNDVTEPLKKYTKRLFNNKHLKEQLTFTIFKTNEDTINDIVFMTATHRLSLALNSTDIEKQKLAMQEYKNAIKPFRSDIIENFLGISIATCLLALYFTPAAIIPFLICIIAAFSTFTLVLIMKSLEYITGVPGHHPPKYIHMANAAHAVEQEYPHLKSCYARFFDSAKETFHEVFQSQTSNHAP